MSSDAFNSVGGYTVGIPPIPLVNEDGNITSPNITTSSLTVNGDANVTGTVTATTFRGTFEGGVSGDLNVPGQDTWILYNNDGLAGANANFTFDVQQNQVTVAGTLNANVVAVGNGINQFYSTATFFTTTNSTATDQHLYSTPITDVTYVEFTIVATNTVSNDRQVSKLNTAIAWDENLTPFPDYIVDYNEINTIKIPSGTSVGDFKVEYDGTHMVLTVTPSAADNTQYKILVVKFS